MSMPIQINPIKCDVDYEKALDRINEIFDAKEGTKEADELDILFILVENYEKEHYPIEAPTAIQAIEFRMDQENLTRNDLTKVLGDKSTVSRILNGKRELTLDMVRKLYNEFKIPLKSLISKEIKPA